MIPDAGFTNFDPSIAGKWLQFLKDAAPALKRVVVLIHAGNSPAAVYLDAINAAAPTSGIQVIPASAHDGPTIDAAFSQLATQKDGGVIVPPSALSTSWRARIIALAAQMRLPAIYPYSEFAVAGGLMSYGYDRSVLYQSAAEYVDRILKGDKAGDLPVQTPTKFELVINLKAAKKLGLTISESFLSIADHTIE